MDKKIIQLQSILMPKLDVCNISELYFHKIGSRLDFNGYFNIFYIKKHKKYTNINNLSLTICLNGYKQIVIVHDGIDIRTEELASDTKQNYRFEFPYNNTEDGVFWFALIEDTDITEKFLSGMFITEEREQVFQAVNIGIDICTFKRESFVLRNLSQLINNILKNKSLDVATHLKVYVIDNGNTLHQNYDIQQIIKDSDESIQIYSNKNAGGVGGFTRGMLEALKEKENLGLTHILLMDDDAIIEPDSLVRLFGLLTTIKDEWKQAAVGGGIFREDYPGILYTAGEKWDKGNIVTPNPLLDMRIFENCICQYIKEPQNEFEYYSGWWCCCYPLTTVNRKNLPLPIFIHLDDIEYGIRNKDKGIIYLNGIDVWHRGFELTMPRTNLYFDVRNNLILITLYCKKEAEKITQKYIFKMITSAILRLKYKEIYVVYKALMDFFKGPEWLVKQEPEALLKEVNMLSYQLEAFETLQLHLKEDEFYSTCCQIEEYCQKFGLEQIKKNHCSDEHISMIKYLTYNGWLLPATREKIAAISVLDSPFATYRKRKIVIFEPGSKKFIISERKYKELLKGLSYNIKAFYHIDKHYKATQKRYINYFSILTDAASWEQYLDIEK